MLIPAIGLVVVLVLLILLVTSRYKVAGPNQAFIVTGRKGKAVLNPETGALTTDLSGQKVILGGGTFVIPFVQKLSNLDLSSRRISVQIRGAVSGQGIKLNVEGVAIVKVGGNADQIRLAAQRFLSHPGQGHDDRPDPRCPGDCRARSPGAALQPRGRHAQEHEEQRLAERESDPGDDTDDDPGPAE